MNKNKTNLFSAVFFPVRLQPVPVLLRRDIVKMSELLNKIAAVGKAAFKGHLGNAPSGSQQELLRAGYAYKVQVFLKSLSHAFLKLP